MSESVERHGRDYLPESFDLEQVINPQYRPDQPNKWQSSKGFNRHEGMKAAHTRLLHPGQGKVMAHSHSINNKSTWRRVQNEPKPGENPYALSYPETAKENGHRKEDLRKHIGSALFMPVSRTTSSLEDKAKCNSLRIMESLDKGYYMTTNKSPNRLTAT